MYLTIGACPYKELVSHNKINPILPKLDRGKSVWECGSVPCLLKPNPISNFKPIVIQYVSLPRQYVVSYVAFDLRNKTLKNLFLPSNP